MAMECEEFRRLVDNFRANPKNPKLAHLSPQEIQPLREHVAKCEECYSYVDSLLDNDEFHDIHDTEMSEEENAQVEHAFLNLIAIVEREDPQEKATRELMIREVDEVDCRDENTVRNFIASHPELAPEKWGISTKRYSYAVFFLAADALGMLLTRTARHKFNDPNTCFEFAEDGGIFHERRVCLTGEQVQGEVARMIRDAQNQSDELDLETAGKLVRWLFWALAYGNWNIIFDYAGSMPEVPSKLHVIALTPTHKSRLENDVLDGWK